MRKHGRKNVLGKGYDRVNREVLWPIQNDDVGGKLLSGIKSIIV